jgi:hypothetical protein
VVSNGNGIPTSGVATMGMGRFVAPVACSVYQLKIFANRGWGVRI